MRIVSIDDAAPTLASDDACRIELAVEPSETRTTCNTLADDFFVWMSANEATKMGRWVDASSGKTFCLKGSGAEDISDDARTSVTSSHSRLRRP